MDEFERGVPSKIVVEFTYPDGSTKLAELENPKSVTRIVFAPEHLDERERIQFDVSAEDWRQNPGMMVYGNVSPNGIPFCTHNGCK